MLRPFRTVFLVFLTALTCAFTGCTTLYRPVYSPGKSNYKTPPEKKETAAELLPPNPESGVQNPALIPPEGAAPALPAAPAAPAPGGLEAPPAIPGLPPP
ncbi:MAG TPA: hypothetical protein VEO95_02030 [Chthoniobacteraceae bacterium]|nr:hypothetical protein [Chthoniobacteraceae bacterium]